MEMTATLIDAAIAAAARERVISAKVHDTTQQQAQAATCVASLDSNHSSYRSRSRQKVSLGKF